MPSNAKTKKLTVKQNLAWNTCGCLLYQACQWLTTILVVTLSPSYENSGILAFAMATGNVFSAMATYNMRTYQVSDVDNEYSQQNYIGFRIATVCASLVVFLFYSILVSPTSETFVCMIVYLLFKSDEAFTNVLYGIDQRESRMDYIGISQILRGVLSLGAFASSLALSENLAIALAFMLASCLIVTLAFDIPFTRKLEAISPDLNKRICLELLRKCAPIVSSLIVYMLVATIARQYYGIVYGEELLGIYAAVATPCVIVQVLANYLYSPFLVPLANRWSKKDRTSFSKSLVKLFGVFFAISVFCILGALLIGPWFLETVYGTTIAPYSWTITPAIVAAALMAANCFLMDLFTLLRKFWYALAVNSAALIICIASIAPLTQQMGMNGVNVTLILSFSVAVTAGLAILKRIVLSNA